MANNELVGIVGTGTMGSGIAQVAALNRKRVIAVDVQPQSLERAKASITDSLSRMVKKGAVSDSDAKDAIGRIQFSTDYADLAGADLLIEAATEAFELKRSILRKLAEIAGPESIIATNTSSLSVTLLAADVPDPTRFIGIHFFNPVPLMPLVEVVRGVATNDATSARAASFVGERGKTPIVVRNSPGFVVNRLLIPMINEAFFLLGEGVASAEEIDQGMKLGANHPIGPLALADLIGLDVCLAVMDVLLKDFGDGKYRAAPALRELVAAGRLGKKARRGVYLYE
ncbi:3-hydroxyacyl-CoA dehydrogenase NAD-binding domain-containing protein [Paraburkholderia sediminicola]|uniref:3-hydroxyacyl-CoA dehydrogenase NAD-binding domain-containing protein n=1 Tax=Paraburkholderia rhynchosiae TaxID=487049 RepID=A0ACC7NP39_9BURK